MERQAKLIRVICLNLLSKTSGAIQAALPLLLVIYVFLSQAVPKSQIFNTVPPLINNKLGDLRSLDITQSLVNNYLNSTFSGYFAMLKEIT